MANTPTEKALAAQECRDIIQGRFEEYFTAHGIDDWMKKSFILKIENATGLSSSTIRACFNGSRLTTATLVSMANYFHLSTDYLLGLTDDMTSGKDYSDIFFYLKHMMDAGILVSDTLRIDADIAESSGILKNVPETDRPDPTSSEDWPYISLPTFSLAGEFKKLLLQYVKISKILDCEPNSRYLDAWKEITLETLGESKIKKYEEFHTRVKEVQDTRKITNVEMKEMLHLTAKNMVYKYRGGEFPVPRFIIKMSEFMHVSSDHLLGLTCNYDSYVSNRDLLNILIKLYHQNFLRYFEPEFGMGEECIHINNPFFFRFCKIYHSRIKVCKDAEQKDFYDKIRAAFAYRIIPEKDMPDFEKIGKIMDLRDTIYMEDDAARLEKYYNFYPNRR